jgi:outer membrane protein OmpA-like peptidoglycan-associated protein
MLNVKQDKDKIEQIAVTYEKMQDELYEDLRKEFSEDLEKWNAILDRENLSIRFREPDVLFQMARAEVRPEFQRILDDFIPRYISILMSTKYKSDVDEIRIEGHTSSEWQTETDEDISYVKNMWLSQERTRSVLQYVLSLPFIHNLPDKPWLKARLTANGLSSSKLILQPDGSENRRESRRVEFRVRTNAEKRIVQILKES